MKQAEKISIFDLDGTLLKENVSFSFGKFLFKEGKLPFFKMSYLLLLYLCHKFFGLSLTQLQQKIFNSYFLGKDRDDLDALVSIFLSQTLHTLIYPPAIKQLNLVQAEEGHTVIMSSSPDFLVGPIAKLLKVEEWYATRYAINQDRKLCHIESIVQGETKAGMLNELAARMNVGREQVAAYSDSYLDLPFLQAAGFPVGVNPDRKLLQICRKNYWKVI